MTAGVTVIVTLDERWTPRLTGSDSLCHRAAGGKPGAYATAVSRNTIGEWPLTVRLTDANSMAGQSLSALSAVDLEVQVSRNGQPGLANAVLAGLLVT